MNSLGIKVTNSMKKVSSKILLLSVVVFFINFFGQILLLLATVASVDPFSYQVSIYSSIWGIFMFPIVSLLDVYFYTYTKNWFPGTSGYIPMLLNSVLWAVSFYFIANHVLRKYIAKKSKKMRQ